MQCAFKGYRVDPCSMVSPLQELLLELHSSDTAALRSKVLLTVVEMLGFGICGVDRCLMGQGCLGVLKGVTAGGLLVWALLDFVLVVACSLSFSDHLKGLGYNVTFESSTVTASFWLCLVLLVAQLLSACRLWRNMSDRYADVESEQEAAKPEACKCAVHPRRRSWAAGSGFGKHAATTQALDRFS
ncbi:unnamed protein product [Prorocentrum cordatum]|uniref:TM2 domain-containing protein n=1 Tax=Prorocentrum cordatum TaxID=2364126 RepID=A0ABN9Y4L8_9DINO|nr:unnamed protein product [Polarella glacialis]